MKYLALAILIFFSFRIHADELVFAPITAHLADPGNVSERYSGCLHKSCDIIYNPVFAYRFKQYKDTDYISNTFMVGLNSVHDHIAGYYFSFGSKVDSHSLGLASGFYLQDNGHFRDKGIIPFSILEVNRTGVVPIFGIEYQYFLDKNSFASVILTPVIANFGLGVTF